MLIVFDLDGTLFGGRDRWPIVSRIEAVRHSMRAGCAVRFVSGRSPTELDRTVADLQRHLSAGIKSEHVHLVGFRDGFQCAADKATVLRGMQPTPGLYVGDRLFDAAAADQAGIPFAFAAAHFGEE